MCDNYSQVCSSSLRQKVPDILNSTPAHKNKFQGTQRMLSPAWGPVPGPARPTATQLQGPSATRGCCEVPKSAGPLRALSRASVTPLSVPESEP